MNYLLLTEMGLLMKPPGCQLLVIHTKVKFKGPLHPVTKGAGVRLGTGLEQPCGWEEMHCSPPRQDGQGKISRNCLQHGEKYLGAQL